MHDGGTIESPGTHESPASGPVSLVGAGPGDAGIVLRNTPPVPHPDNEGPIMLTDPEQLHEQLRPAWHVVVATVVMLAVATLAAWFGH